MEKLYLYPSWLRMWHWLNALLFLILIITGISLHYSNTSSLLMPFKTAMTMHNICGVLLSANYLFYVIFNIVSKNYKYYIPKLKGLMQRMIKQGLYYSYGIFKGEPHPYEVTKEEKFNPLQQLTYFGIMFFMMPLIVITGWFLMFPEYAPEQAFGVGGVTPMAVGHSVIGYLLSLFMFGHIYLATHGETVTSNFKSMVTGYHEHGEHHK